MRDCKTGYNRNRWKFFVENSFFKILAEINQPFDLEVLQSRVCLWETVKCQEKYLRACREDCKLKIAFCPLSSNYSFFSWFFIGFENVLN